MGVSCKKFTFTKNTATGNQTVTGIGFTPKALILWENTCTNESYADIDQNLSYGFCDGSLNQYCVSYTALNSVGATIRDTAKIIETDSIVTKLTASSTSNTQNYRGAITSFNSDGFVINWAVNTTPASVIHGIAIGGTDITNVKVTPHTVGQTTNGNRAYTGIGFQPDFMIVVSGSMGTTIDALSGVAAIGIGAATSSTKRWTMTQVLADGSITNDYVHRSDRIMHNLTTAAGLDCDLDFVSFDSDGFTLAIANTPSSTSLRFGSLCIKGGQWDVGTLTQPDATGVQNITTAGIDTHKGVQLVSGCGIAVTAGTAHSRPAVGGTDGVTEGCTWSGSQDAAGTASVNASIQLTSKVIRLATEAATASSSTTNAEADFSSFSTNQFALNWTTVADTTNRIVSWWAVGEAAAAGNNIVRALPTETITVGESVNRLLTKSRGITETVTKAESVGRLATKSRSIPTQTVVITENVARTKAKTKAPAAETVTVGDGTVARLAAKSRPIIQTTTISENAARLAAKNRALATQTVTVGAGTVIRLKGAVKTIVQTVAVGETLNRLTNKIRVLATQTVTIGESVNRLKAAMRSLSQIIIIAENVSRQITGGAQQITRTVSDTVVISESLNRLAAKQRTISQNISISENLQRRKSATKTLSLQTVSISELVSRLKSSSRSIIQSISLSESPNRLTAKLRSLSETITITGLVQGIKTTGQQNIVRTIIQTVTISEQSLVRQAAKSRVLLEIVQISEQLIHDHMPIILGGGGTSAGAGITRPIVQRRRPTRQRTKQISRPIGVAILFIKTRVSVIVPILILHTKKNLQIKLLKMPIVVRYASLPVLETPKPEPRIFYTKTYTVLKGASLLIPTRARFKAQNLNLAVNIHDVSKFKKLTKIIELFKVYTTTMD